MEGATNWVSTKRDLKAEAKYKKFFCAKYNYHVPVDDEQAEWMENNYLEQVAMRKARREQEKENELMTMRKDGSEYHKVLHVTLAPAGVKLLNDENTQERAQCLIERVVNNTRGGPDAPLQNCKKTR